MGFDFDSLKNSFSTITLGKLIPAIIIMIVGIVLVKILDRFLKRVLKNIQVDERIKGFVLNTVKILLYLIVIIIAISTLGINMNAIVAVLSIFSLGIALALENLISNMASGIMLITTKPFVVGQYIEADDKEGTVQAIQLNHTTILTPEGSTVVLPNNTLANSIITNFNASEKRRLLFNISCAYSEPTEKVKQGFLNACARFEDIEQDPAPEIYINELRETAVEYNLYVWVPSGKSKEVKYGFLTILRDEMEKCNVAFARPQIDIKLTEKAV